MANGADRLVRDMVPQCRGCGRPAIHEYRVEGGGTLALCLECSIAYEQLLDARIASAERQINYSSDLMEDTFGLPRSGPRCPPRPPRLEVKGMALKRADVAIGALKRSGEKDQWNSTNGAGQRGCSPVHQRAFSLRRTGSD